MGISSPPHIILNGTKLTEVARGSSKNSFIVLHNYANLTINLLQVIVTAAAVVVVDSMH
jgi:hypothetical protein